MNWPMAVSSFAAALLISASLWSASAQTQTGIAAVVNDDVVSFYDLNERLKLVIFQSNLRDSPELRQRFKLQILDSLINEKLKLREAKRLNITVEKEEIDREFARLEKLNRIRPGRLEAFLAQREIKLSTLEDYLRAGIAWEKVKRRIARARRITVSEDEVDEALAREKENLDKPGHLVSELFLAVDTPNEEAEVLRNANRLLEQIRDVAAFSAIARQFSEGASARNGGDLGWVQQGRLEKELDKALLRMRPGEISKPIRTSTGYHVLLLRDRRVGGKQNAQDAVVTLRQVFLPLATDATQDEVATQTALARTISQTVSGCEDMAKLGKELGSNLSGDLGKHKVRELSAELQQTVLALDVNRASRPLPAEGGLRVLMVCDRKDPRSALPSRTKLQRRLMLERLELHARRHLRDLRQTAFVEIR